MDELRLSSGDRVQLHVLTGRVADDRHSSDTRFYSVGGGGYVGPHGGHVAAPRIRSVTDQQQTVWITDDHGQDHALDFTNLTIPLRVGQRLTALYCQFEGSDLQRCEYVVNHHTRLHYCLARQVRPIIDFKRRYAKGPVMALLLWAFFLGAMLIWLKPIQPADDTAASLARTAESTCSIDPRARRPAPTPQQLAQARATCLQLQQQARAAAEAERSARHAWWVPALSAFAWMLLVLRNADQRNAFGRRLYAEYLEALERRAQLVSAGSPVSAT